MSNFRFRAWPTESKSITQHFGANPGDYARFGLPGHEGIDLAATVGSNIFAVAAGTVEHVFPDNGHPYGNNVRLRHANGYETIYAHLDRATVVEGQKVKAGDVIGLGGKTGRVTGPHLHLTLKRAGSTFGTYPNNIIDPSPFLLPLLDPNWNDATFVRDLIPDGSVFQAGQTFTQTWFLRNSGNRRWQPGYALACINGPAMAADHRIFLPAIPVQAETPVTVEMTAPAAAGSYTSVWQVHDDQGNPFGDPVWVSIEVVAARAASRAIGGDFIRVAGREFRRNGQPFRFFGYNLRGLAHYGRRSSDPLMFSSRQHQESQLRSVYDLGARVVRVFLPDQDVGRGEIEGRLRDLLGLVRTYPDLYLLPAFTNLYDDVPFNHPGDDRSWLFQKGLLSQAFFNGRFRENYLPFVQQIVGAFRDEVSIFAWEIGNELKLDRANLNDSNDPNPWLFVRFNQEVAATIKASDPNHLVTTGMKSTHHAWLHTPTLQDELYRSPNIDFVTIHSYEGKFDRDGDLRVYDDAGVAVRCNKPFIIEEAGFDHELFPDRVSAHRDHLEKWLGLGASGYMPWGFIHAREIGDGDNSVGVSAELDDFGPLCALFRSYADQINASNASAVMVVDAAGGQTPPPAVEHATFVRDTVADGTTIPAGQPFSQSFTLRNTGQTTWGNGYRLVWIGGVSMESANQVNVPPCAPGSEVTIPVTFIAPTAGGRHQSIWQMSNDRNQLFGQKMWVDINVEAARRLAPAARIAISEGESDLRAALRRLTLTGLASSQSLFEKLPSTGLPEALTLAALGIASHAYWSQVVLAADSASQINSAAAAAFSQIQTLLTQQQERGGGSAPSTTPLVMQPVVTPPVVPALGNNNPAKGSTTAKRKRALCIGIDDYVQQPLSGCVADAKLWVQTLLTLGFEQPQTLFNSQATRNAIIEAVTKLVQSSQAGDVIVVQYAGHGIQLGDVSGDETGGDTPHQDEGLAPFDFSSGAYVIDDDLGKIFEGIPNGVNVTCFMDCCHSGSISRVLAGSDERSRELRATREMIAAHQHYREGLGGSRAVGKREIEQMREVVFSACQSKELAWEKAGHGEFTLRATKILQNGAESLNHQAFMQAVTEAFGESPRQNPLLECASVAMERVLLQAIGVS